MILGNKDIKKYTPLDELKGKLASNPDEERLMRSVLDSDEEKIDEGRLVTEGINQGMGAFNPDMMFEQIVQNYSYAKKLYGKTIIELLTTYGEGEIARNIRIPEFQKELRQKISKKIKQLKQDKILDRDNNFTPAAEKLAALILYTDELENLSKGFGGKAQKKYYAYGYKDTTKPFKKDRYRDLAVRKTLKLAVRRGHSEIQPDDLVAFDRKSRGERYIIYALDSSGSMKGTKISKAKKAGIALAYKAIEQGDKVGLLVFGADVTKKVEPTNNFLEILTNITGVRAKQETDIAHTIHEAINLFPDKEGTKHLIIITDAMPTRGENPEQTTLEAVSIANSKNITISAVGIKLEEGEALAEKIVEIGKGRLYKVQESDELDKVVLQEYDEI